MDRQVAIKKLKLAKPLLEQKFGVSSLGLFGSTARGESTEASDLDLVVAFKDAPTAHNFFGVQFYLEDSFGCDIDLVSEGSIRAEFKPYIERDLIKI